MLLNEPHATGRQIKLLALLAPLFYVVNLGTTQLRMSEALLATIAREFSVHGDFLRTTLHGEHVDVFPLYSWCAWVCRAALGDGEWSARLPSLIAVLVMAWVAGWFASQIGGRLCGAVTAAIVLTNLAFMRLGCRAQLEIMLGCFLTCAWVVWFHFGQQRKRWMLGWTLAMLFVVLGTATVGARAIAYFYFPFIFMRRPVRGRRRLISPPHFVALGLLLAVVLTWASQAPDQPFMPWNAVRGMGVPMKTEPYLYHLIAFPVRCVIYLMPWTFFCWTPFCEAFMPVEKNVVVFRYFRAIVGSVFISTWLLPNTSVQGLIPIVPALAIMVGLHYPILARRHGRYFSFLPKLLWRIGLGGSIAALLLVACHMAGIVVFRGISTRLLAWNTLILFCTVLFCVIAMRRHLRAWPYWLRLVVGILLLRILVAATVNPFEAWAAQERKHAGQVLAGLQDPRIIPPSAYRPMPGPEMPGQGASLGGPPTDVFREGVQAPGLLGDTIYRYTNDYFVTECFYLGKYVEHIRDLDRELPKDDVVVYVLGGAKPPIQPTRTWTTASRAVDARQRNMVRLLWVPGGITLLEMVREASPPPPGQAPSILRIYRGELR